MTSIAELQMINQQLTAALDFERAKTRQLNLELNDRINKRKHPLQIRSKIRKIVFSSFVAFILYLLIVNLYSLLKM